MLRVEIARPDYQERIRNERDEDEAAEMYEAVEEVDEEDIPVVPSTKALYFPIPGRKNKVRFHVILNLPGQLGI